MTSRQIRRLLAVLTLTGTALFNSSLVAQWQQTSGPGGGNVSCFLAGGSTVFAGTAYDGVYRSTDSGSTWSPARTGLVSLAVQALVSRGPALYVATSSGIQVSTDGGRYWNQLPAAPHGALCLALSGSYLVAGVQSDGVYVSRDSGANWMQTLTLLTVTCLTVSGSNLYAGTEGSGVYLSTDNGLTWSSSSAGLTGGALFVWGITVQGGTLFASAGGKVYTWVNGGDTWTQTSNGLPTDAGKTITGNGSALFAGTTSQGVYVSTNNGSTWSPANTGLPDLRIKSLAWNGDRILVGLGSAGVYASTNSGATWSYSCNGMPDGPTQSLARSGSTLLAGGFSSGVFISTDNGNTWSPSNQGLTDPTVSALLVTGQTVFAGTQNGVSRSTNGGVSWTAANAGMTGVAVDALAASPGGIFAGVGSGTAGGVWRSTDNGVSWTQTNNGLGTPVQAFCLLAKGTKLFVGTSVGIFVSTDYGNSWNLASTGLGGSPSVAGLAADSSGAIYAGVVKDVFRSTNDGASWTDIGAGISGYSTYTFAIAGTNVFGGFMGGGVYCLTGGGPTWNQENSALGDLYIYALTICGNYLFAGTSAFGVWRRFLYDMIVPVVPVATPASSVKSVTFTATWNAALGAKGYRLDVSTDSTFGSFVAGYNALDVGNVTAYPVSGLASLTTYYYRVRASNDVGASGNSNTVAIRTLQPLPASPTARNADSLMQNSFRANWSLAAGAVTYRIDVATDINFTAFVAGHRDADVGSGMAVIVTGLSPATDYYYQVRGMNPAGEGPSSNTIKVTTLAVAPGAPTATGPTNVSPSGFTANWSAVAGVASYDLDVALDSAFVSFMGQYNNYNAGSGTSYPVTGLPEATLLFYRVRGRNSGGPGPYSNVATATTVRSYPAAYTLGTTVSFNSANTKLNQYGKKDYRLTGIPGNINQQMSAILGGTQGTDWEVYWDNGSPSASYPDYLVRLTVGDSRFVASTGRAFWLLHLGDWVLSTRSVPTAALDTALNAVIPLTAGVGFNLITSPFTFPIPWAQITAANGITDSLSDFTSGGWVRASTLVPYKGYLFYNSAGKTLLRIPLNSALPRRSLQKLPDPAAWRVDVIARSGGLADQTTSIGVSTGALAGLDAFEQRKPRQMEGFPEVYLRRPEWDAAYPFFATDIRPPGNAIDVWDMTVRADNLDPTDVEFKGIDHIPPGSDALLIDESAGCARDLRKNPAYHLAPHAALTQLKVAVGTPASVRALAAGVVPERFALLHNYPNPFNPSTTIPVEVPADAYVRLEIFDVLGRSIAVLYDGAINSGRHYIVWNGTNSRGGPAASGAYFIRLNVRGGPTLTGAMSLTK